MTEWNKGNQTQFSHTTEAETSTDIEVEQEANRH